MRTEKEIQRYKDIEKRKREDGDREWVQRNKARDRD